MQGAAESAVSNNGGEMARKCVRGAGARAVRVIFSRLGVR
jgi:hypothetical protein